MKDKTVAIKSIINGVLFPLFWNIVIVVYLLWPHQIFLPLLFSISSLLLVGFIFAKIGRKDLVWGIVLFIIVSMISIVFLIKFGFVAKIYKLMSLSQLDLNSGDGMGALGISLLYLKIMIFTPCIAYLLRRYVLNK